MMDSEIVGLPRWIVDGAKQRNNTKITLSFSGGSDEGYLDISVEGGDYDPAFARKIEQWAWDVYSYSGAGEGHDYGDDICYDLETMTVDISEWYMERTDRDCGNIPFAIVD